MKSKENFHFQLKTFLSFDFKLKSRSSTHDLYQLYVLFCSVIVLNKNIKYITKQKKK